MLKTITDIYMLKEVSKMSSNEDYIQVITTTDSKESAEKIAKSILSARLAGCVQIVGLITSYY